MIFYFSATGNSKHVAEILGKALDEKVCSVTEYDKDSYSLEAHECLGIVTPTYFWELPSVTRDFLQRIRFERNADNYVFGVCTYGTTPGASGAEIDHWLREKGMKAYALFDRLLCSSVLRHVQLAGIRNRRACPQTACKIG